MNNNNVLPTFYPLKTILLGLRSEDQRSAVGQRSGKISVRYRTELIDFVNNITLRDFIDQINSLTR